MQNSTTRLVRALIISSLDYCHSLLTGLLLLAFPLWSLISTPEPKWVFHYFSQISCSLFKPTNNFRTLSVKACRAWYGRAPHDFHDLIASSPPFLPHSNHIHLLIILHLGQTDSYLSICTLAGIYAAHSFIYLNKFVKFYFLRSSLTTSFKIVTTTSPHAPTLCALPNFIFIIAVINTWHHIFKCIHLFYVTFFYNASFIRERVLSIWFSVPGKVPGM